MESALVERDAKAWWSLLQDISQGMEPNAEIARQLYAAGTFEEWRQQGFKSIDVVACLLKPSTTREFELWLLASWLLVVDATDPERFAIRYPQLQINGEPNMLEAAEALYLEWRRVDDPPKDCICEVCLWVVDAALGLEDYRKARHYAYLAAEWARAAGLDERRNFAWRRMAKALVGLGRMDDARDMMEQAAS
ncbi:MAG: hypothetical protein R3E66_20465 [bacterium]